MKEKRKTKVDSIIIRRKSDNHTFPDYLETKLKDGKIIESCRYSQKDYDNNTEQVEKWIEEDHERLQNYAITWFSIGIIVEAQVSYPIDNNGNRRLEWFSSGGLWGIESDSEESYLKSIEEEETENLKEHLKQFNVDVSSFNAVEVIHKED